MLNFTIIYYNYKDPIKTGDITSRNCYHLFPHKLRKLNYFRIAFVVALKRAFVAGVAPLQNVPAH